MTRLEIPLTRLPRAFDGFTIAQLSDFHYEHHFSVTPIRKAVEMVNALHPDLIALTGDFVTVPVLEALTGNPRRFAETAEPCAKLLQDLRAPMGRFAVLGNHDGSSDPSRVARALRDHGMPVLINRAVPLVRGRDRIWPLARRAGLDSRNRRALAADVGQEISARTLPSWEPDSLHQPRSRDHSRAGPHQLPAGNYVDHAAKQDHLTATLVHSAVKSFCSFDFHAIRKDPNKL